jgi:hypothetical protein
MLDTLSMSSRVVINTFSRSLLDRSGTSHDLPGETFYRRDSPQVGLTKTMG